MTHTELIDQMQNEIIAYNAAFTARRDAQDTFAIVASDDGATDEQYNAAAEKMQKCNAEFARLDQSIRIRSEKALGRGRELGRFFEAVARMR